MNRLPLSKKFKKKEVCSPSEVIVDMGNHFLDSGPEVLVLDTKNCVDNAVVTTV